jgi:hypothetical protein
MCAFHTCTSPLLEVRFGGLRERVLGQRLKKLPKAKGGEHYKKTTGPSGGPVVDKPTLNDIGCGLLSCRDRAADDEPEVTATRYWTWSSSRGPAASELRRRCARVHHGSDSYGSAEYKFAARRLRLMASSPRYRRTIQFAEPAFPIQRVCRCARDRKGQVASRRPSATLDGHSAQRPTKIRSGRGDGQLAVEQGDEMIRDRP